MLTPLIAKAVCISVHVLGCTSELGLLSKPVLSSCLYLSLITEDRDGAQGKTRVLPGICLPIPQRPGLREGCDREQKERGLPTLGTLLGPQGSQGISHEHCSQEVGTGRAAPPSQTSVGA